MALILVVDDDPGIRSLLQRVLVGMGHVVHEAQDGRAALASMAVMEPDLVITDINMPDMDGIELTLALQGRSPATPVIAMSAGGRMPKELLLDSARILGAVSALPKPFDVHELQSLVTAVLAVH